MSAWSETSMAKPSSAGSSRRVVADERVETDEHDVVARRGRRAGAAGPGPHSAVASATLSPRKVGA